MTPAGGTAACLGMLLSTFVEIGCRRARVAGLAAGPSGAEPGGSALDHRVALLREPVPGALFANLHVTAVTPGPVSEDDRPRRARGGGGSWQPASACGSRSRSPLFAAEGPRCRGLPPTTTGRSTAMRTEITPPLASSSPPAGGAAPSSSSLVAGAVVAWLARRRSASELGHGARRRCRRQRGHGLPRPHHASPGEPTIGWPLLWAIRSRLCASWLDPRRVRVRAPALTRRDRPHGRCDGFLGYWASGASVGMLAAGLFIDLAVGAGARGRARRARTTARGMSTPGSHLYTEPLSTALIVGATALLVRERLTDMTVALAGLPSDRDRREPTDAVIVIGLVVGRGLGARWRRRPCWPAQPRVRSRADHVLGQGVRGDV